MKKNQQVLQPSLVNGIYDAAIDPEIWPVLLDEIAASVGSVGSAILSFNPAQAATGHSVAKHSTVYKREDINLYEAEYSHYERAIYADIAGSIPGDIIMENGFDPLRGYMQHPSDLRERPDVRFLRERYGVFHRMGVRLNEDQGRFEGLTCQFSENKYLDPGLIENVLQAVYPHLAQTLLLARTFEVLKHRYAAVLTALDRVKMAMFILVDKTASVLICNESAQQLVDSDGLFNITQSGQLVIGNVAIDAEFRQAIMDVIETAHFSGHASRRLIGLPRGEGRDPCLIEVSPLRDPDDELNDQFRGALVSVIDPDLRCFVDLSGFEIVYSLTPTETAVATLLVDGLSTTGIAELRGVSAETVKSQISSLFIKTKSRNRTELVRRALMMNVPVV